MQGERVNAPFDRKACYVRLVVLWAAWSARTSLAANTHTEALSACLVYNGSAFEKFGLECPGWNFSNRRKFFLASRAKGFCRLDATDLRATARECVYIWWGPRSSPSDDDKCTALAVESLNEYSCRCQDTEFSDCVRELFARGVASRSFVFSVRCQQQRLVQQSTPPAPSSSVYDREGSSFMIRLPSGAVVPAKGPRAASFRGALQEVPVLLRTVRSNSVLELNTVLPSTAKTSILTDKMHCRLP